MGANGKSPEMGWDWIDCRWVRRWQNMSNLNGPGNQARMWCGVSFVERKSSFFLAPIYTGWWFGTCFIFHFNGIILPIDFHIFKMVETTNENFHNFHRARDIPTAWLAFRRTSQLRWTREFGASRRRFIFGAVLNALIAARSIVKKGENPGIQTDPYRSLQIPTILIQWVWREGLHGLTNRKHRVSFPANFPCRSFRCSLWC